MKMSEKENKFILGDNSDGYRRSADSTQPFELPPQRPAERKPQPGPKPVRPSARPSAAQPVRKKPQASASPRRKTGQALNKGQPMSANEKRRLHNELRKKQRRRKQILTYIALALGVVAIAVILSLTVFFQINEITIKGDSPYTDEQIIGASGISLGENIIRCGADEVSGNLSKSLPYISSATVERSASGKVVITVKRAVPEWSFINGEQAVLIDKTGKVLEIGLPEAALEATIVQGATVTYAVPGEEIVLGEDVSLSFVRELGAAFDEAGIDLLTTVNLSDTDYIQALYDGRYTLIVGSMSGIDVKLALAAKVIDRENEIDPNQHATLDLTVDNKVYFRPEENPDDYSGDDEETSAPAEKTTDTQTQAQ